MTAPSDEIATVIAGSFDALWNALLPIGRDPMTGGYHRLAWTDADMACRDWFTTAATERELDVETDRNGNLWAWWTTSTTVADAAALVVGSHLDSVRDGGAFDGPLGIVSAFAALDVLRAAGHMPRRPIAVAAFADEEGARFGIACAGSRLLTGTLDPDDARGLHDPSGATLARAMTAAGHDPGRLGRDDQRLARIGVAIELHIEQGRALDVVGAPIGLASGIWPHGRYRFTHTGEANHAGTTAMTDRRDPMQAFTRSAIAVDAAARARRARATFGRLDVHPDMTNAVPSRITAWLDARAPDDPTLTGLVDDARAAATRHAHDTGTTVEVTTESTSPAITFDPRLRAQVLAALEAPHRGAVPVIATAAGHDAGVLAAAGIPTAMVFVRNPTGVSHASAEHAERDDCLAGVRALARAIEHLAS